MLVAMLLLGLAMADPQPLRMGPRGIAASAQRGARPPATATVAGRVIAHDARPLLSAVVIISPVDENEPDDRLVSEAKIEPDGRFSFIGVPRGRYVIRVRGETSRDGASLFAIYAISVDGTDVRNIEMILQPAGIIEGEVMVRVRHGHLPKPLFSSLRVRAPLADGSPFGDTPGDRVRADGRFRLRGVTPGVHVLTIEGLTFPWRISEARVRGRDVTRATFEIDHDQVLRDTRIVLTDTAAGVFGTVALPAGVATEDVLVVAFPADAALRQVPVRFVRAARLADDRSFRVLDLAPGEYLAVAATGIAERDVMDPDLLEQLEPLGTRVTLVETKLARLLLAARPRPAGSAP
ncbi:MAG TPA: carboxypeptidase-like regulatory domain-containing protein [Vicinamibacterales bacterium]|nr:carboxypeptidase-like regulatory domain-containing protein [Vicinamibacterales bacterium]